LRRLAPVDLVLVEGYKRDLHPKIEVWRRAAGHEVMAPHDSTIRAVATDSALPALGVPLLDLNNTAQVANFIAAELQLGAADGR
jgi:molybdopterin-guanine dinucleotide biosynthesis protein MobB